MAQAFPLDTVEANLAYVGLPLFGERSPPGGLDEVRDRQARDYLRQLLIPVVDQAADELPTIVTEIAERTCAKANTPALLGFGRWRNRRRRPDPSPGAIQAAVLVNTVSSPAAAVALSERLSGSPYPWDNDARAAAHRADLAAHATAVAAHQTPPALLILHGANDEYATPDNHGLGKVVFHQFSSSLTGRR
jgi:hypothetical protein